jgi:hypothetical protein
MIPIANRKPKIKNSIYLWLIIFHLFLSTCATCYTLSVGHLPPPHDGSTFLLITDLSGLGPAVEINFYDDVGRAVSTSRKLLPPRGKIQINVENYLQIAGTIVLESSNEQIVGEYWQVHCRGGAKPLPYSMFMLPLQPPVGEGFGPSHTGRYFVNCFQLPPCSSSLLVLSDPYGSGPLVQMEFYNRTGELIRIARKLLRPHGTSAFNVNDYAPWDVLGKVSIRSLVGGSIVLHYRQLCDNNAVLAVPAHLPARDLLIDEFSIGREITSKLIITDASAEGPAAEIQFLSDSGEVLSKLEKLLPPNGTVLIDPADYIDDTANGVIKISSGAEIIADYWEKNPQTVLHTPAVHKTGSDLFISHFSLLPAYAGIDTQDLLSLLNIGQEPVKAEIQFYNSNGEELDSKKLVLEPYKQVDELITHYFDIEEGATLSPTGTIIVSSSNASLVATSHIFDLKNSRHLGKAYAQVIR